MIQVLFIVTNDGHNRLFLFIFVLGLGLEKIKDEKKIACPARVAEAGQENIETVHEPEPIQTTDSL